jgi:hypothetical protein
VQAAARPEEELGNVDGPGDDAGRNGPGQTP